MDSIIRLRVKKDIDARQHKSLLELKGSIIAKGYTDIIHINDEGEAFHINSFITAHDKSEVTGYINSLLEAMQLSESVWLL